MHKQLSAEGGQAASQVDELRAALAILQGGTVNGTPVQFGAPLVEHREGDIVRVLGRFHQFPCRHVAGQTVLVEAQVPAGRGVCRFQARIVDVHRPDSATYRSAGRVYLGPPKSAAPKDGRDGVPSASVSASDPLQPLRDALARSVQTSVKRFGGYSLGLHPNPRPALVEGPQAYLRGEFVTGETLASPSLALALSDAHGCTVLACAATIATVSALYRNGDVVYSVTYESRGDVKVTYDDGSHLVIR